MAKSFLTFAGALSPDSMKAAFVRIRTCSNQHRPDDSINMTINDDNNDGSSKNGWTLLEAFVLLCEVVH